MTKVKHGIQKINLNTKLYNVKIFKYNKKNSLKNLEIILNKRKLLKKINISVKKLYLDVKKNGDKAVIKYEKKFSKIKINQLKLFFQKKK